MSENEYDYEMNLFSNSNLIALFSGLNIFYDFMKENVRADEIHKRNKE